MKNMTFMQMIALLAVLICLCGAAAARPHHAAQHMLPEAAEVSTGQSVYQSGMQCFVHARADSGVSAQAGVKPDKRQTELTRFAQVKELAPSTGGPLAWGDSYEMVFDLEMPYFMLLQPGGFKWVSAIAVHALQRCSGSTCTCHARTHV